MKLSDLTKLMIRLLPKKLRHQVRHLRTRLPEYWFDYFYGLDTRKRFFLNSSDVDQTVHDQYAPIDWLSLTIVLNNLDIKPTDAFLDLGSGKGRALLIASGFPFRKIIGVEISNQLCEIASQNVEKYLKLRKVKCYDIEIVNTNAFTYRIPPEVTVVFLQNPFPAITIDSVLKNLETSVKSRPRKVIIIYFDPEFSEKFVQPNIRNLPVFPEWYRTCYKIYELQR